MSKAQPGHEPPKPTWEHRLKSWFDRVRAEAEEASRTEREKSEAARNEALRPERILHRQTVAAELSALSTFIFSLALTIVAVLQWMTAEKANKLSYALAEPRFEITSTPISQRNGVQEVDSTLHLKSVNGVYAINAAQLEQNISFIAMVDGKGSYCNAIVKNYYSSTDNSLEFKPSVLAKKVSDFEVLNKATPKGVFLSAHKNDVLVSVDFQDIFRKDRHEEFSWTSGLASRIILGKSDLVSVSLDSAEDGRPVLRWIEGVKPSRDCLDLQAVFNKFSPPRNIKYQYHSSTRKFKNSEGDLITETTTWKTPIIEP